MSLKCEKAGNLAPIAVVMLPEALTFVRWGQHLNG